MSIEEHSIDNREEDPTTGIPVPQTGSPQDLPLPSTVAPRPTSIIGAGLAPTLPSASVRRIFAWASPLFFSPLWLCLLIALVLRIWLVVHTNGVIDGDEALVGIQ